MTTSGRPQHQLDYDAIMSWPFQPLVESYSRSDTIAYARGVGAGMPGPLAAKEEVFLVDDGRVQALPAMAIVLNQGPMWTQDPKTGIDWTKTVHAEEGMTIHRPIAPEDCLVARYEVDAIYDKGPGRGALMYETRTLSTTRDEPVATIRIATFLRGNGGFGGSNVDAPKREAVPADRGPDATIDVATPSRANTRYHLPAAFVDAVRSDTRSPAEPMLRGVGAFGVVGRAVLELACATAPARMKHLSLRYTAPIFAEETLRTDLWFTEPGKALFRVRSVERDVDVMSQGAVHFID